MKTVKLLTSNAPGFTEYAYPEFSVQIVFAVIAERQKRCRRAFCHVLGQFQCIPFRTTDDASLAENGRNHMKDFG
jgi:hypothetical protein